MSREYELHDAAKSSRRRLQEVDRSYAADWMAHVNDGLISPCRAIDRCQGHGRHVAGDFSIPNHPVAREDED